MNHLTARRNGFSTLVAAALLATGCATAPPPAAKPEPKKASLPSAPPVPARNEIVLENGMRVAATTPQGRIRVDAGPGLLRRFTWDGATRAVVMKPRAERYAGSLGIYYEGVPTGWEPHNGIYRVDVEEGQHHFDNLSDAKIWMQIRRLHYVHTSDGLVVGWKRKGETLQVEVWQFYIDGEKPSYMPGAKDHLVDVSQSPLRSGS